MGLLEAAKGLPGELDAHLEMRNENELRAEILALAGDGIKTLRDEFAIAAMQGDWAAKSEYAGSFGVGYMDQFTARAKTYYMAADAMLRVRTQQQ